MAFSGRSIPLALFPLFSLATMASADLRLEQLATGLNTPLFLTSPAGDSRKFIVEKPGRIRVVENGSLLPTPFLDLTGDIDDGGERGLLGLAFDPNSAANGRFYVNYIDDTTLDTVIARYQVSGNPNIADAASAQTILTVDQPGGRNNHKGGWIGFRPGEPDNLYIATGDGGGSNDPDDFAQDLSSNLGKILRVDVSDAGPGFAVPAGNPFVGQAGANDEIWDYGLRNPFRNSFDRATGDFYIGDVGQGAREEINFEAAADAGGNNYGWRPLEGSGDNPNVGDPAPPGAVDPIFDYEHGSSPFGDPRGSVIGGYVYQGSGVPELGDRYLFGDFVTGTVGSFEFDGATVSDVTDHTADLDPSGTLLGGFSITSFGEDAAGELYLMTNSGDVFQIVPEPSGWWLAVGGIFAIVLTRVRRQRQVTKLY